MFITIYEVHINYMDEFLNINKTNYKNQKPDKTFNKITSLDNDVNKKGYVINDDGIEIIKNIIKDERAKHIVLNMDFKEQIYRFESMIRIFVCSSR